MPCPDYEITLYQPRHSLVESTGPSPTGMASPLPSAARHIPSLDGIRAVSFMLVFAAHAGVSTFISVDFGVTVFFFLSGFLITTLMRSEFDRNGSVNIRHFWLRRALRILPPFYVVALAATLMALILYPPGTVYAPAMTAELLFYANYWGIYGINREAPGTGVVWSLAVEEQFYLLFPLLYISFQKLRVPRSGQAWLLWGLCALILAWRCALVMAMHTDSTRIYIATDTRVDSVLFGCALAVWNNPVLDEPTGSPGLWKFLLLPAALAALLICFLIQGIVFRETWYFSIQGAALTLVFIAAIRFHTWPLFRFLNWRPVVFIGTLSYSLYLVHDVLLRAVARLWPQSHGWQRAPISLAASIIAAWAIYVLVERPCARLRKRLTH
jgi:peptidoglycan/LPS O-acetylase OafA/YrhL